MSWSVLHDVSRGRDSKVISVILGECLEFLPYDLENWEMAMYNSGTIPLGTCCVVKDCPNFQSDDQNLQIVLTKITRSMAIDNDSIFLMPLCKTHTVIGCCFLPIKNSVDKFYLVKKM